MISNYSKSVIFIATVILTFNYSKTGYGQSVKTAATALDDSVHTFLSKLPGAAKGAPSSDVPPGAIKVTVTDVKGTPISNAGVQLGILRQDGKREKRTLQTDVQGIVRFTDLSVTGQQAYRVSTMYNGATYSSTPFQLSDERGYAVTLVQIPTTPSERAIVQWAAEIQFELRDERVHVLHQVQFLNLGSETHVFPSEGKRVHLPKGFVMFQSQAVMTDQKISEVKNVGFRITGSLPPGETMLSWGYDLPAKGSDLDVNVSIPWRTYTFAVASDAPPGLTLTVDDMPAPSRFNHQGRWLWFTQTRRQPTDPSVWMVHVHIRGIPGPGPARWIALTFAIIFVLGGLGFAFNDARKIRTL